MVTHSPIQWTVLGAGAIGGLWASYLYLAGKQPRVLLRETRSRSTADHDLKLESQFSGEPVIANCAIATANHSTEPISHLLVTTKAHQTLAALSSFATRLSAEPTLVLLQNGMGVAELISEKFPQLRIFQATTTEGAWRKTPRHIVHAGQGETWLQASIELAETLSAGPLNVRPTDNIQPLLWRKLAINCVINPLSALHECNNGRVVELAEFAAVSAETVSLVKALCPELRDEPLSDHIVKVARATAANRSSMWVDRSEGRTTENEFLSGFLMHRAKSVGLDCPQTEKLYRALL